MRLSAVRHTNAQVASKAGAVRASLVAADGAGGAGFLTSEALEGALGSCGLKFTCHQVISLRRKLDRDRAGSAPTAEVLAALGIA